MDDKTLVNTGMAYSEKIMEAVDEVLQALLAALFEKDNAERNHVLEEFAKYVQRGGRLHVAQFDSGKLKEFEKVAKVLPR